MSEAAVFIGAPEEFLARNLIDRAMAYEPAPGRCVDPGTGVSRADVADFMLQQVSDDQHVWEMPIISDLAPIAVRR